MPLDICTDYLSLELPAATQTPRKRDDLNTQFTWQEDLGTAGDTKRPTSCIFLSERIRVCMRSNPYHSKGEATARNRPPARSGYGGWWLRHAQGVPTVPFASS